MRRLGFEFDQGVQKCLPGRNGPFSEGKGIEFTAPRPTCRAAAGSSRAKRRPKRGGRAVRYFPAFRREGGTPPACNTGAHYVFCGIGAEWCI